MKKLILSIICIISISFFLGCDEDSNPTGNNNSAKESFVANRTNDSLALIAILNENPDFSLNWDKNEVLDNWENVVIKRNRVTKLDLNSTGLSTLPSEFSYLTALTELNLSANSSLVLSEELWELKNLQFLYLRFLNLTVVPSEISNLRELLSIELNYNELKTLPAEIGQLSKLRGFNIAYNDIETLPEEITSLNYAEVNANGNKLKANNLSNSVIEWLDNCIQFSVYGDWRETQQ